MLLAFALTLVTHLAHAQSAAQLELDLKKKPDSIRLREEAANAYFREGKADKVIELLNPYTDTLDQNGFLLLATSYSSKKDYANEVRVLKILADANEQNYKVRMLLGQAYIKQAMAYPNAERFNALMTSGVQELRRVMQINPNFKPGYDLLLKTLLEQKNNNEARELLHEGIQKFGDRPELYRELCRLDANDGFLQDAVKFCRVSLKLSPNYPDHWVYLVQALLDQDEDQQAERTIVTAAKRFPSSEFIQWTAGTIYLDKKNYPVSARYYKAAVKADPNKGRSQYGLAQALFENDEPAEALPHFIAACKTHPASIEKFLSSGSRLKQKGQGELGGKYMSAADKCR